MGSLTNLTLSRGTATRCSPMPRKPPTPITTALMLPLLSVSMSLIEPILSLLSLYTLRPTIFEARQVPWYDEDMSDAVAGAGALPVSAGAVGDCANATVASNAEPARPAMVYLANIRVLLSSESVLGKPAT